MYHQHSALPSQKLTPTSTTQKDRSIKEKENGRYRRKFRVESTRMHSGMVGSDSDDRPRDKGGEDVAVDRLDSPS